MPVPSISEFTGVAPLYSREPDRAQTFTAINSGDVVRAQVVIGRDDRCASQGDLLVQITAVDAAGKPAGEALAEAVVPASEIPFADGAFATDLLTARFDTPAPVSSGRVYALITRVADTGACSGNTQYLQPVALDRYPGGSYAYPRNGGWELVPQEDAIFGIYVEPTPTDTTAPTNVAFVGGINGGASFLFGDVPEKPTCTAEDAVGVVSCVVSGYSSDVGTHTLTAKATDAAGNEGTKQISYTVKAWTLKGFYSPVDMGNGAYNTAKNGSTVPLKFEVFKGTSELMDTALVKTFTQKVDCVSGTIEDTIENYATGETSLRYDTASGQFVFNWKTPKAPGACYKVTMSTQDGSPIAANFKLK